jgi:hypothetical protein
MDEKHHQRFFQKYTFSLFERIKEIIATPRQLLASSTIKFLPCVSYRPDRHGATRRSSFLLLLRFGRASAVTTTGWGTRGVLPNLSPSGGWLLGAELPAWLPVGGGGDWFGATHARRRWLMQHTARAMRSRAYSTCTTSPAGRPRAAHRSTRLRYPITLRLPLRVFLSFFLPGEYNHGQRELLRPKSIFSRVP